MRNKFPALLIVLLASVEMYAHPVHVSVINLDFRERELYIRIQTYVDDWETAYFHYTGKQIDFTLPENYNGQWFNEYLLRSFKIGSSSDNLYTEIIRDSTYFNDLSMTIEFHATLDRNPKTLYIYNAVLTDIFADQTNLLIFSVNGKEKGIKFDIKKKQEDLKLR